MNSAKSLEAAIDPSNRLTFLLDWELTLKCNLDCSYCTDGHDNTTRHPSLSSCLNTIDFMFKYVDQKMSLRPAGFRFVVLNVYGGESLHHPHIVDILQAVRNKYAEYQDKWKLHVTTTTNAILSHKKLKSIIPLIDEFTVSYHTENTNKQKQQFLNNLLTIKDSEKPLKCVVLMHADPDLFANAQGMIEWLQEHNIKHLPRQLDHAPEVTQFNYAPQQVQWFDNLYTKRSHNIETSMPHTAFEQEHNDLAAVGRACCGGRQLCADQNYRKREFFVPNRFPDWFCSVDYFFLYIKQVTGEVFVNKDCKMNYSGQVGPIGYLTDTNSILDQLNNTPTIQCKKFKCSCGLCAPKAQDLNTYQTIMRKYEIPSSNLLHESQRPN